MWVSVVVNALGRFDPAMWIGQMVNAFHLRCGACPFTAVGVRPVALRLLSMISNNCQEWIVRLLISDTNMRFASSEAYSLRSTHFLRTPSSCSYPCLLALIFSLWSLYYPSQDEKSECEKKWVSANHPRTVKQRTPFPFEWNRYKGVTTPEHGLLDLKWSGLG